MTFIIEKTMRGFFNLKIFYLLLWIETKKLKGNVEVEREKETEDTCGTTLLLVKLLPAGGDRTRGSNPSPWTC